MRVRRLEQAGCGPLPRDKEIRRLRVRDAAAAHCVCITSGRARGATLEPNFNFKPLDHNMLRVLAAALLPAVVLAAPIAAHPASSSASSASSSSSPPQLSAPSRSSEAAPRATGLAASVHKSRFFGYDFFTKTKAPFGALFGDVD